MKQTYAFTILPSIHSKLSASGAERWLACPGSIRLGEGMPNASSFYAAEGTAAHWIAAACQKDGGFASRWNGQVALVEGYEIPLTEELTGAVQEFLDFIVANEKPGDVNFVEQSFTPAMKKLHPDFGGSSDRVMWRESEKLLRIYDYKHGAGVAVSVIGNKQLKYYALGALLANAAYKASRVEMVIAQPRCEHSEGRFRRDFFDAVDLIDFSADLLDGAEAVYKEPKAPLVAGKQCDWCPAAPKCPLLGGKMTEMVSKAFDIVPEKVYSVELLAKGLEMVPLVEARIAAIRELAYTEAMKGVEIPGFKLVDKRANRKWTDEKEVTSRLIMRPEYMTQPQLKSPAQIETILGKKEFKKILGDVVEQKSSGRTLVPAADPRPVALLPSEVVGTLFDADGTLVS